MQNTMTELLEQWCEALVALELPGKLGWSIGGGTMCPACAMVHGRCADAIYPLLYLAHRRGRTDYVQPAMRLLEWADRNVGLPDGGWINDIKASWGGITVFGAMALGEALRLHADVLDSAVAAAWRARLARAAGWLLANISMDEMKSHINYPMSCAATLATCWRVLGDDKYLARAKWLAGHFGRFLTPNMLVFGEGRPMTAITARGCRAIDVGYNVEETLQAMVHYARLTGDGEVLELARKSFAAHLPLVLEDGAWDNSWGCRMSKWTYWGSRTSDGCQAGLVGLAALGGADAPAFAEAARRNLELYRACTHGGLLHGGPHTHVHGERPCVHHTFCHAKGLAAALDVMHESHMGDAPVPTPAGGAAVCGLADGVRQYPEALVTLAARGPWRATFSACDHVYYGTQGAASGGSMTLLWHRAVGPVLCGSMTRYEPVELLNMPLEEHGSAGVLTPHVLLEDGGVTYRSLLDRSAEVAVADEGGTITVRADGKLVDHEQRSPNSGPVAIRAVHKLTEHGASTEWTGPAGRELTLWLPVIAANDEPIERRGDSLVVSRRGGRVTITFTNAQVAVRPGRTYNHVPGLEAAVVEAKWHGHTRVDITTTAT